MKDVHTLNIQIDAAKCTACKACELACSFTKEGAFAPASSRIRVLQLHHAGMNVPTVCMNCVDAPCVDGCFTGAMHRDEETGMVLYDANMCVGCWTCIMVCPFGAIRCRVEGSKTASKCDLCQGKPVCVTHCIYGALSFGPGAEVSCPEADSAPDRGNPDSPGDVP